MPKPSGLRRDEDRDAAEAPKRATGKKRRDPLWARLMIILGALIMMTSGGVIVGGQVLIGSVVDNTQLLGDAGTAQKNGNSINGPLNMLLVGTDERPDSSEPPRSDTIIILHVPASHDRAYLISLPRDLLVTIPEYKPTKTRQHDAKINSAYTDGSANGGGREGGFALLALTISKLVGIKFNAAGIVNFSGFQKVVEQLGGVDMCVDARVESAHIGFDSKGKYKHPRDGGKPVVYEPGCRRMAPWQALDYVRQRKGDDLPNGDYDRQRHQQQFLKAIMKEAKKQGITSNPVKAFQMMKAAGEALTVDTQGASLDDWAYTMRNVTDNELIMIKTNAGKVASVQHPTLGSCETLTDESRQMLASIRTNTLAEFILAHPDFVASSDATS